MENSVISPISRTQFTLFHASKACQTDVQEISDTKDISLKVNSLLREIKESTHCIHTAYEDQSARLAIEIVEKMEMKIEEMKKTYRISLDRVERCSRTEMANAIATLWRKYEGKFEEEALKVRKNHADEMQCLETKIKECERKNLTNTAKVCKNKKAIEKWIKVAKKPGHDLLNVLSEDKAAVSQMEMLENLQKSLNVKEIQLVALRLQYEQEIELRDQKKEEAIQASRMVHQPIKVKNLPRTFLLNHRGSVVPRQESSSTACNVYTSNMENSAAHYQLLDSTQATQIVESTQTQTTSRKASLEKENSDESIDFENFYISGDSSDKGDQVTVETIATMEKEFEKEREEELKITQQLEEEFRRDYEILTSKAIKSQAKDLILKQNKELFKVILIIGGFNCF